MHLLMKQVVTLCLSISCVIPVVAATTTSKQCALPNSGGRFEAAQPEEVNLDPDIVAEAITYARTHNRFSVQIFRNNCRIAAGPVSFLTDDLPSNIWSVTKSVIGILTGIAYDKRLLSLNDPIGKYLPSGIGWSDDAHRAITIRDLLTETSGLDEAIIPEALTAGFDANAPQEALAQPLKHKPGTYFEYSQRVPDLLAYVVERAAGQDLQQFAQINLFGPIGIPSDSYFWLRDRSGNTYGYAWLFIPPIQLAKLGLLMQNAGEWNGHHVVSGDWVWNVAQPTKTNPCYGYLFWTNAGKPCTGANFPTRQTFSRRAVPSLPDDAFFMVGAFHQNNFVIPSLGMTVTWTGFLGDTEPNLGVLLSAAPGDLYNNFFRILMRSVQDKHISDTGPLHDPLTFAISPGEFLSPSVLLNDLASNRDCNFLVCNETVPTAGALKNVESVADAMLGIL